MKIKFNQTCRDKNTKQIYDKGGSYEFEDERGQEILETGLAELVEDEPVEEIDNLDEALEKGMMVNLYDLTVTELKKLAKEEGVSVRGTKDEIVERIMAKYEEVEGE